MYVKKRIKNAGMNPAQNNQLLTSRINVLSFKF